MFGIIASDNLLNKKLKILKVVDKAKYVVAEDRETVLIRPEGIQTRIDEIVGQFDRARAFIRS